MKSYNISVTERSGQWPPPKVSISLEMSDTKYQTILKEIWLNETTKMLTCIMQ